MKSKVDLLLIVVDLQAKNKLNICRVLENSPKQFDF